MSSETFCSFSWFLYFPLFLPFFSATSIKKSVCKKMIIFCWSSFEFVFYLDFFYFQIKKSISVKIINFLYTHIALWCCCCSHKSCTKKWFTKNIELSPKQKKLFIVILFWGFFVPVFSHATQSRHTHMHSFEAIYCVFSLLYFI